MSLRFYWGICIACAALLAWSTRHSMNSDGLSYLDIASETFKSGPLELINGYWSPGYPALISIFLLAFTPSPAQEVPLLHLLNFCIFLLTLWSFSTFLRSFLPTDERKKYAVPFAFGTFIFFTLKLIGVETVTPDLAVAAIIFLAAGIVVRLSLRESGRRQYLTLGFVLALGYYLKAAMFPLGITLLVILLITHGPSRMKLLLSCAVFLVVSAPLIIAISNRVGKPSFGETGSLNYAWFVGGLRPFTGWTGNASGENGSPLNAPRRLMDRPLILEFATPIKGTYALWYDPSYWYAGSAIGFDLQKQLSAFKMTFRELFGIDSKIGIYASGALVLCVFLFRERLRPVWPRREWWLLVWPIAATSMYMLVHVEGRFLGALFVLFWLAVYSALALPVNRSVAAAVCATVMGTVLIPFVGELAIETVDVIRQFANPSEHYSHEVAGEFMKLGVRPGDKLAVVGYAANSYYAKYGRLRVVAQLPDADQFWSLSSPELKSVSERLASIGVRAIVARNGPETAMGVGWNEVRVSPSQRFRILLLPTGRPD